MSRLAGCILAAALMSGCASARVYDPQGEHVVAECRAWGQSSCRACAVEPHGETPACAEASGEGITAQAAGALTNLPAQIFRAIMPGI